TYGVRHAGCARATVMRTLAHCGSPLIDAPDSKKASRSLRRTRQSLPVGRYARSRPLATMRSRNLDVVCRYAAACRFVRIARLLSSLASKLAACFECSTAFEHTGLLTAPVDGLIIATLCVTFLLGSLRFLSGRTYIRAGHQGGGWAGKSPQNPAPDWLLGFFV